MAVDAVGGTLGGGAGDVQRSGLSQDDFLKIFLTQLTFQDPLNPVDNREFLAQLAQFASLEQNRLLNENINSLLTVQASSQALGLIGRTVEIASANQNIVGSVTTVHFVNGSPLLTVKLPDGSFIQDLSPAKIVVVR